MAMRGGLARFDSLRFVAASWAARGRFAAAQPQFSRVWAHRPSHAPLAVRAAADRAAAQTQPHQSHQSHTVPPAQTAQTARMPRWPDGAPRLATRESPGAPSRRRTRA
ncbi:hypothetical protein T210_0128750 [Burkholderia pseudomallei MSHR6137]|nr:hypothetical protein T210_0128750 [Burkholderia pseudomallei MSHR6137]